MKAISYKEITDMVPSSYARAAEGRGDKKSYRIKTPNNTLVKAIMPAPGVFVIESRFGTSEAEIISAGIHGNEMAGVHMLDGYLTDVLSGRAEVRKNLLIFFGNLLALGSQREIAEIGDERDNLNRVWNRGVHKNPVNYAQRRANCIIPHIESVCSGSGEVIATDMHQSFIVPRVSEVRGANDPIDGDSQYNYMAAYPHENNRQEALQWIYDNVGHIVAGVIINDMTHPEKFTTLAGYIAKLGGISGTYEQGQIGHNGGRTYAPQLMRALSARIAGNTFRKEYRQQFDAWNVAGQIIKSDASLSFYNENGKPTKRAPVDFMSVPQRIARQCGEDILLKEGQRVVFANPNVNIGDRAAVIIEPYYHPPYTHERDQKWGSNS